MKGTYILIESDDDYLTQQIRDQVDAHEGDTIRVIGLFLRPDDFCKHGNWTTERGHPPITQMHIDQVGWYVCTQCMKPIPTMGRLVNQVKPDQIKKPFTEKILGRALGFYVYSLGAVSRAFQ